ncbi:MAG TPA: lytic transglycosylase domain-containing protein [Geobacteraceae bacterium]
MGKIANLAVALLLLGATGAAAEPFCFDEAGTQYSINPQILRAIAKVESNFNPRAINWNTNGSYDFGVMQINSSWAPALGMERWNSLGDTCSNIKTGAMILANCMKKYGYTWEAIGCYNSQTPDKRDRYARAVFKQLQRIQRDDKVLKANVEAAVRDRINDLVQSSQNGGGEIPLTVKPTVSAPPETSRNLPVSHSQEETEVAGAELRASSLFEGTTNGM